LAIGNLFFIEILAIYIMFVVDLYLVVVAGWLGWILLLRVFRPMNVEEL